jgi:hypothetical protein
MKQAIFKVLSVFVAVVAVAMMGTALATFWVHPDVRTEMNSPSMQNYSFVLNPGENPTWAVTRRFTTNPADPAERGNVGTFKTAYEALAKAHQDLKTHLAAKTTPLVEGKQAADTQVTQFKVAQEQDLAAVLARAQLLSAISIQSEVEVKKKSEELETLSVKSREIREETAARRTDVLRLRHELAEARTDLFRLSAIRRDLTDRLIRLEIENDELRTRQAQVSGQTLQPSSDEGQNLQIN